MAKSLNKVILIGNLTRDPELKYTPNGVAVCTIGLATNRQWTTDSGEKKEEVDFHRLVAWNKLAEICANLLKKGRKIYAEGRLQTRTWQAQDGSNRSTTEVVLTDMIVLDSKRDGDSSEEFNVPDNFDVNQEVASEESKEEKKAKKEEKEDNKKQEDEDIPF
jgi:single-strand DNA-binding protein